MSATGSQVNAFDFSALKPEDIGTATLASVVRALLASDDNYSDAFRAWLEARKARQ